MSISLFVYGTLMVPALFRAVTGKDPYTIPAVLHDYARRLVLGKSYPVVLPEAGQSVEGKLCLHVSDAMLERLDAYEGVAQGLYVRIDVRVETEEEGQMQAITYAAGPNLGASGEIWTPENPEMEAYLAEQVAPYLEARRLQGTIPSASTIL